MPRHPTQTVVPMSAGAATIYTAYQSARAGLDQLNTFLDEFADPSASEFLILQNATDELQNALASLSCALGDWLNREPSIVSTKGCLPVG